MSGTVHDETDGARVYGKDEPVATVATDGVTLEKHLREVGEGVWQLRFNVCSGRSDRVDLRIEDPLPAGFPPERVGFHEAFDKQNWCIEGEQRVVHETSIGPDEPFLTIYAVRPTEDVPLGAFTDEPTVEVTPSEDDANAAYSETMTTNSDNGTPVDSRDTIASTGGPSNEEIAERIAMVERNAEGPDLGAKLQSTDGPTNDETVVDGDEESATIKLHDPTKDVDDDPFADAELEESQPGYDDGTSDRRAVAANGTAVTEAESAADDEPATDEGKAADQAQAVEQTETVRGAGDDQSQVAALMAELSGGMVPDEEVDALRQELLGPAVSGRGSLDVRMRHVEQELNELTAYSEAMASFLDDQGEGRDLLRELDDRTSQTAAELESVKNTVSGLNVRVDAVEEDQGDDLEAGIADLSDELKTLRADRETSVVSIEANAEQLGIVTRKLDAIRAEYGEHADELEAELTALSTDVEAVRDWHRQFTDLFSELSASAPHSPKDLDGAAERASVESASLADVSAADSTDA